MEQYELCKSDRDQLTAILIDIDKLSHVRTGT